MLEEVFLYLKSNLKILKLLEVLPSEYQGKGLGRHLVSRVVTASHGVAPFVKLFVLGGNSAELLYRQLGFMPGPRYVDFKSRG